MDDLISRQAAIDAINKAFKRVFTWDGTSPLGEKVLKDVPSADAQPVVQGEWVEDVAYYAEDGCPCVITRCNQCGEPNLVSKFCPNCGARMGDEWDE